MDISYRIRVILKTFVKLFLTAFYLFSCSASAENNPNIRKMPYPFLHSISFASDVDMQTPWFGEEFHNTFNHDFGLQVSDSMWVQSDSSNLSGILLPNLELNKGSNNIEGRAAYFMLLQQWHRGNIDHIHSWHDDSAPNFILHSSKEGTQIGSGIVPLPITPIPDEYSHYTYPNVRFKFSREPGPSVSVVLIDSKGYEAHISPLAIRKAAKYYQLKQEDGSWLVNLFLAEGKTPLIRYGKHKKPFAAVMKTLNSLPENDKKVDLAGVDLSQFTREERTQLFQKFPDAVEHLNLYDAGLSEISLPELQSLFKFIPSSVTRVNMSRNNLVKIISNSAIPVKQYKVYGTSQFLLESLLNQIATTTSSEVVISNTDFSKFTADDLKKIFLSIPTHCNSLKLSNINFNEVEGSDFSNSLGYIPNNVTKIDFSNNDLSDKKALSAFTNVLKNIPFTINYLSLQKTSLGKLEANSLGNFLKEVPKSVISIDLEGNNINWDKSTSKELKHLDSITTLFLSWELGKPDFSSIPSRLSTLNLKIWNLGDKTGKELNRTLKSLPSNISTLSISTTEIATKEGIKELAKVFSRLPGTISYFGIHGYNLTGKNSSAMLSALKEIPSGKDPDVLSAVGENIPDSLGIFNLLPATVNYLEINSNNLGKDLSEESLLELFSNMPSSIKSLDISDNDLTSSKLFSTLKSITTLFTCWKYEAPNFSEISKSISTLNIRIDSMKSRSQKELSSMLISIPSSVKILSLSSPEIGVKEGLEGLANTLSAISNKFSWISINGYDLANKSQDEILAVISGLTSTMEVEASEQKFSSSKIVDVHIQDSEYSEGTPLKLYSVEVGNISREQIYHQEKILKKFNIFPSLHTTHGGFTNDHGICHVSLNVSEGLPSNVNPSRDCLAHNIYGYSYHGDILKSLGVDFHCPLDGPDYLHDINTYRGAYHENTLKSFGISSNYEFVPSNSDYSLLGKVDREVTEKQLPIEFDIYGAKRMPSLYYSPYGNEVGKMYIFHKTQYFGTCFTDFSNECIRKDKSWNTNLLDSMSVDSKLEGQEALFAAEQGPRIGALIYYGLAGIEDGLKVDHLWYTHFGTIPYVKEFNVSKKNPIPKHIINSAKVLSEYHYNYTGKIADSKRVWVAPAATRLRYLLAQKVLKETSKVDFEKSEVRINSIIESVIDSQVPNLKYGTKDLHGITFYVKKSKDAKLFIDDSEYYSFTRNKVDETGRESITIFDDHLPTEIIPEQKLIQGLGTISKNGLEIVNSEDSLILEVSKSGTAYLDFAPHDQNHWNISHVLLDWDTQGNKAFIEITRDDGQVIGIYPSGKQSTNSSSFWTYTIGKQVLGLSQSSLSFVNIFESNVTKLPIISGKISNIRVGIDNAKVGSRVVINAFRSMRPNGNKSTLNSKFIVGGQLVNTENIPVANRIVTLEITDTKDILSTISDDFGYYVFHDIPSNSILQIEAISKDGQKVSPTIGNKFRLLKNDLEINFRMDSILHDM
jgi:hypothetical protein